MTKRILTRTEQNQLAFLVGVAVVLGLSLIFPATRGWITERSTDITDYAYGNLFSPVLQLIGNAIGGAWSWLTGLVS